MENHHLYKIVYQWAIFYKIILNDQRVPKETPRSHKNSPCSPEPLRRNILRDVWRPGTWKRSGNGGIGCRSSSIGDRFLQNRELENFTKMRLQVLSWCSRQKLGGFRMDPSVAQPILDPKISLEMIHRVDFSYLVNGFLYAWVSPKNTKKNTKKHWWNTM